MAPAIRSGDEVTVEPILALGSSQGPQAGDIVLAELGRGLVVHRVAAVRHRGEAGCNDTRVILRGDASDPRNPASFEEISSEHVLGRVADVQPCLLQMRGVSKRFRSATTLCTLLSGRLRGPSVEVLRHIDLELRRGDVVAVVGENGAGKSTLLRLAAGLITPTTGEFWSGGHGTYVAADDRAFAWRLTGRQNLAFYGRLEGFHGRVLCRSVDHALERSELADAADRPVREYSSGMRQRLGLARALLSEAELLLLDEPTRGVDRDAAARLREWVGRELVATQRRTLLMATHEPADVDALGARTVALRDGTISL
jgi:ABC-2 type transport system ATP-binding protein